MVGDFILQIWGISSGQNKDFVSMSRLETTWIRYWNMSCEVKKYMSDTIQLSLIRKMEGF